jgi:RES domain-containing protein
VRFAGRCYRGHDPKWSFTPLSGDGAAARGGRFNRPGEPALYLALDLMTAVNECTQGLSARLQPLLLCEYEVDCTPVADLRDDAGRAGHGVTMAELDCGWMTAMHADKNAPSWLVADKLRGAGHCGVLVPSFVPGSNPLNANLVLWSWGPDLPHRVNVFDPSGRLPKNQLSW